MTNSEQAIREFADGIMKSHETWGKPWNAEMREEGIEEIMEITTALISEHYYPKEFVEWLLKQDSYPQDNGGTYFLVNGVAGDDATLLFYHWNKYIKKENER